MNIDANPSVEDVLTNAANDVVCTQTECFESVDDLTGPMVLPTIAPFAIYYSLVQGALLCLAMLMAMSRSKTGSVSGIKVSETPPPPPPPSTSS